MLKDSLPLGINKLIDILKYRSKEANEPEYQMKLHDGSLLIMGKNCQSRYCHSLLPDKAIKNGRINLTFRNSASQIKQ